jgi:hypothetical protein
LTFIPNSPGASTIGIGRAVPHAKELSLEMQMSSGVGGQTTAHWAIMVRVRPGDPDWDALPGFGISVPEMLAGLEPPQAVAETCRPERAGFDQPGVRRNF